MITIRVSIKRTEITIVIYNMYTIGFDYSFVYILQESETVLYIMGGESFNLTEPF